MSPLATRPLVTLERVFTPHFLLDVGGDACNDVALFVHPNGLVVLCLAPSHWAVQQRHEDVAVAFNESLLGGEVSGKRKRGAATVQANTVLVTLSASGGRTCRVRACVRAKLLEVNTRLRTSGAAQLLHGASTDAGFVAVLMPFDAGCLHDMTRQALTREAYDLGVSKRSELSEPRETVCDS